MNEHKNIGSDFDDFLAEEGELGEVSAVEAKRVIAWEKSSLKEESSDMRLNDCTNR